MNSLSRGGHRTTLLNAWLLAALLLVAQALGLAHRVHHAPGLPAAAASTATATDVHTAHAFADGHTAGSSDCRLIDQLAHADALCADTGPLVPTRGGGGAVLATPAGTVPAGATAAYLARGPPAPARTATPLSA